MRPMAARKDKVVHVRFSSDELCAVEQAADDAGMTLSAFLRSLSLDGAGVRPLFSDEDRAVLALLCREIRAIGVNLNQLARAVNAGGVGVGGVGGGAGPGGGGGRSRGWGRIEVGEVSAGVASVHKVVAAVMFELGRFTADRGQKRRRAHQTACSWDEGAM